MDYTTWQPKDIFLTEDDQMIDYSPNIYHTGRSFKFGQLKLLINEILFIVNHWQRIYGKIHVVYAGTVTGEHIECFASMFDCIERMDLWDPKKDLSLQRPGKNPHHTKIQFKNNYLTPGDALTYSTYKNVFFISDLRCYGVSSGELKFRKEYGINPKVIISRLDAERLMSDSNLFQIKDGDAQWEQIQLAGPDAKTIELELTSEQIDYVIIKWVTPLTKEQSRKSQSYIDNLVIEDHTLQREIVENMKPVQAMLKFRLPYDWDNNPKNTFNYYDGYIYKQAFSGPTSSEARIVPNLWNNGKFAPKYRNYNLQSYDKKMAYYNNKLRDDIDINVRVWKSPVDGSTDVIDDNRLINSFDTCYLFYVLNRYLSFTFSPSHQSNDPKQRQDAVMALWYYIYDTILHYSKYQKIDLASKRQAIIIDSKRKMSFADNKPVSKMDSVYQHQIDDVNIIGTEVLMKIPTSFTEYDFGKVDIDDTTLDQDLY